jgi:hypothetical protein
MYTLPQPLADQIPPIKASKLKLTPKYQVRYSDCQITQFDRNMKDQ